MTRPLLIALVLSMATAAPAIAARAEDGQPEARVSVRCSAGASAELRLRGRDGSMRVRFEVQHAGRGAWNVVLVHERRIGWKGAARVAGGATSFEIERTLADFPGSDSVTARATGPRGVVCQATAVLAEVADGDSGAGSGDHS